MEISAFIDLFCLEKCFKFLFRKIFGRKPSLSKHTKIVHEDMKRFPCDLCNFKSYFHSDIRRHIELDIRRHVEQFHEKIQNFKCKICQKCFCLKFALTSHTNQVHLNLRPFKCLVCSQHFGLKGNLNAHMKRKHT